MKASLKLRDERNPLFRAKVPISVLGLPLQSGLVAGEPKELCFSLSTFFDSGPSIKVSYRPNDSWNPFSLVLKSGVGKFGSTILSPLLMSAEFNLLGKGSPRFMLHLKPRFGDFSFMKSQSSTDLEKPPKPLGLGTVSGSEDLPRSLTGTGMEAHNDGYKRKITILPPRTASAIAGMLSGVELAARTSLPLRSRASMSFRWGIRFPAAALSTNGDGGIDLRKIPFLVMNKISVGFLSANDVKQPAPSVDCDMGDAYAILKRQMEDIKIDNGILRKALDDLRLQISSGTQSLQVSPSSAAAGQRSSGRRGEGERSGLRNGSGANLDRRNNEKRPSEEDIAEELKKSLKVAVGSNGAGSGGL